MSCHGWHRPMLTLASLVMIVTSAGNCQDGEMWARTFISLTGNYSIKCLRNFPTILTFAEDNLGPPTGRLPQMPGSGMRQICFLSPVCTATSLSTLLVTSVRWCGARLPGWAVASLSTSWETGWQSNLSHFQLICFNYDILGIMFVTMERVVM